MKLPKFITSNFNISNSPQKLSSKVESAVLKEKVAEKVQITENLFEKNTELAEKVKNFSESRTPTQRSTPLHPSDLAESLGVPKYVHPEIDLPDIKGDWGADGKGIPGESLWYSDYELVTDITKGKGIPFKNGIADLSQWATKVITFDSGVLKGNHRDFRKLYAKIAEEKGYKTKKAARLLIKHTGLAAVHHNEKQMLLVPRYLLKFNYVWQEPKIRLPRQNGQWGLDGKGVPGESLWYSTNKEVHGVTNGEPIPFIEGRPDFSQWATRKFKLKEAFLDGSDDDFEYIYAQISEEMNFTSNSAAQNYLREAGLTPHHVTNTDIILVPRDLHDNIAHAGSASDMRNAYFG